MRYCASCGSEHKEGVDRCADCPEAKLLTAAELRAKGLPLPDERDTRRFVRAGTAEDPLSAEEIGAAVEAAQIPVFVRARRAGTVDILTDSSPWWEILVPEEHHRRACEIVAAEKQRLEATSEEAARAAEEEELEMEKTDRQ